MCLLYLIGYKKYSAALLENLSWDGKGAANIYCCFFFSPGACVELIDFYFYFFLHCILTAEVRFNQTS